MGPSLETMAAWRACAQLPAPNEKIINGGGKSNIGAKRDQRAAPAGAPPHDWPDLGEEAQVLRANSIMDH